MIFPAYPFINPDKCKITILICIFMGNSLNHDHRYFKNKSEND